jgi:RNA exonuclease 4
MVKCAFCFREFREQDYLEIHIQSQHSELDPQCKFCLKYFNLYDSLRAHLASYGKDECHLQHRLRGCEFCFEAFLTQEERDVHVMYCMDHRAPTKTYFTPPRKAGYTPPPASESYFFYQPQDPSPTNLREESVFASMMRIKSLSNSIVSLDCEFVGVGFKGLQDAVAKVCLIDFNERIVYESFVKPQQPVVDYRFEFSGIKSDDLSNAKSFAAVKQELEQVLTKDKIVVGHNVIHDLEILNVKHPSRMIRDTAYYTPLLKPGRMSKKLKVLAKSYLNLSIQASETGHDPFEDAVAALRIYKKFRYVWERRINHGVEDQKVKCYHDQRKKMMRKLQMQIQADHLLRFNSWAFRSQSPPLQSQGSGPIEQIPSYWSPIQGMPSPPHPHREPAESTYFFTDEYHYDQSSLDLLARG